MAHRVKGSKYHPARISGREKLNRQRDSNKADKKLKKTIDAIDLKNQNWSTKKN